MKSVLMCKPSFFQVKYQINPWMKIGTVDQQIAMTQWQKLVDIYKRLGVEVNIIEQRNDLPDMVFCADQGIVNNKRILLSNFKYKERRGETEVYRKWFREHGFKILTLPKSNYFEGGGETIKWCDKLFIGTGFRTSSKSLKLISKIMDIEIIGLQLIDSRFYHLDTCFFVLDNNTAFYYPPAFSNKSVELIKSVIPSLIEFNEKDILGFAANSTVINTTVVMQNTNIRFKNLLEDLGYYTIQTDVSEFIKSGGGIHCLTGSLN